MQPSLRPKHLDTQADRGRDRDSKGQMSEAVKCPKIGKLWG